MVGADLCVCPGGDAYTNPGPHTQVCPYADSQSVISPMSPISPIDINQKLWPILMWKALRRGRSAAPEAVMKKGGSRR
jgi:hypothetical protein